MKAYFFIISSNLVGNAIIMLFKTHYKISNYKDRNFNDLGAI